MSHYGGEDSWTTTVNAPTAAQISFLEELCEHLGYDCKTMMPDNFDEASSMIDELQYEADDVGGFTSG